MALARMEDVVAACAHGGEHALNGLIGACVSEVAPIAAT
jgi:hypothetical protein